MIEKGVITSFFILISAGCIKATTLGMKLFIMACAGLAGMYMVHLLAQDYNKYQTLSRPGRSVDFVRRSVPDNATEGNDFGFFEAEESAAQKNLSEDIKRTEERYTRNELLSLDRILRFDPTGCARRYVCTIAAKSRKKLSQSEINIIQMLRNLPRKNRPDSGQAAFRHALDLGRRKRDPQACAEEYPKCFLTISQMLKFPIPVPPADVLRNTSVDSCKSRSEHVVSALSPIYVVISFARAGRLFAFPLGRFLIFGARIWRSTEGGCDERENGPEGDFRRKRTNTELTTNGVGGFVFDGNGTVNETSVEPATIELGIDQNVGKSQPGLESGLIIPLYVAIFILSVVGNSLVLATLAQHKRMRTVTNVYLLNLAVSDLLLGVFCMPFTLVGQVLRNFIFGAAMCKLIPYFQAVCVSVGVWTLVAISLERYFAICRPLKSRRWQTQFHAYKMIVFVWISSLLWASPIVVVSRLKAMKMGRHKCREEWPSPTSERAFNLFLDAILLLVPLIIMSMAYSLIVLKLWKGLRSEIKHSSSRTKTDRRSSKATMNGTVLTKEENTESGEEEFEEDSPRLQLGRHGPRRASTALGAPARNTVKTRMWLRKVGSKVSLSKRQTESNNLITSVMLMPAANVSSRSNSPNEECKEEVEIEDAVPEETASYAFSRHVIRSTYMDKSIEAKKKVIRMLFVVVAEFFVCWAPLHVLNTWYLFSPEVIYQYVGSTGVSLVQLLAYISSCCNPITYCFMNNKFRQAFLNVFHRYRLCSFRKPKKEGILRRGTMKGATSSVVYEGRIANLGNRSEIVDLESEDRV